jgi:hypothetical protein
MWDVENPVAHIHPVMRENRSAILEKQGHGVWDDTGEPGENGEIAFKENIL